MKNSIQQDRIKSLNNQLEFITVYVDNDEPKFDFVVNEIKKSINFLIEIQSHLSREVKPDKDFYISLDDKLKRFFNQFGSLTTRETPIG